jgi:hypothetical protein
MLQTIEAIYDPQKGLLFSESVNITAPMKVFVTFVEQVPLLTSPQPAQGSAQALLAALKAHPLPASAQMTAEQIDAQIAELAESWE